MRQEELFPIEPTQTIEVPGFFLTENYITEDEEHRLLENIDVAPWEDDWRRRIQQYGLGYGTGSQRPTWRRDFPDWLVPLAQRVAEDTHFDSFPENCVINEYIPPLGIGPHKDYSAFGPTIACVSLGSDIVIDFTHPIKNVHAPLFVPRRSFWVITGEARSVWIHGIAARLTDVVNGERRRRGRRVSVTFRTATREQSQFPETPTIHNQR